MRKYLQPQKIAEFFLKLFLVTFPFQIQTLLYKADLFSGQFNFFTTFFLGASEIFLILTLLFWGIAQIFYSQKEKSLVEKKHLELFFLVLLGWIVAWNFLSVFWSMDKELTFLQSLRWMEFGALVVLLGSGLLTKETILKYLFWGAFFQVLIAVGQYFYQGSVGLYFLGEPRLGADYFNIAKMDLGGEKILRAYGTFSHSNLFGGYIFVCLSLLIQSIHKQNYLKRSHFLIIFLIGLLISFSRTAWIAFFVFLAMLVLMKAVKVNWKQLILTGVLIIFVLVVFSLDKVIVSRIMDFSLNAWDERLVFSGIAREIISSNYLLGIGTGTFVLAMPTAVSSALSPWLFQPVHNFFLLVFSEIGIVGLLLWLTVFIVIIKMIIASVHRVVLSEKFPGKAYIALIAGMFVILMMDHYIYTIWAGQSCLAIIFGLIYLDYRNRQKELLSK